MTQSMCAQLIVGIDKKGMTKEAGVVAHAFNPNTRVLPLASHCTWKSWPHDSLTCSTNTDVGAGELVFPLSDHYPQACWPYALQAAIYKGSCLASHQELQGILGSGMGGACPLLVRDPC